MSSQTPLISRSWLIATLNQACSLSCGGGAGLERGQLKWKHSPLIKPQIPQIQRVFNPGHVSRGWGGFCLLQNEALNMGFKCQWPDILGQADTVFQLGLMSPFIFITYFYPRAPLLHPVHGNLPQ